jgi:hypothetical protein
VQQLRRTSPGWCQMARLCVSLHAYTLTCSCKQVEARSQPPHSLCVTQLATKRQRVREQVPAASTIPAVNQDSSALTDCRQGGAPLHKSHAALRHHGADPSRTEETDFSNAGLCEAIASHEVPACSKATLAACLNPQADLLTTQQGSFSPRAVHLMSPLDALSLSPPEAAGHATKSPKHPEWSAPGPLGALLPWCLTERLDQHRGSTLGHDHVTFQSAWLLDRNLGHDREFSHLQCQGFASHCGCSSIGVQSIDTPAACCASQHQPSDRTGTACSIYCDSCRTRHASPSDSLLCRAPSHILHTASTSCTFIQNAADDTVRMPSACLVERAAACSQYPGMHVSEGSSNALRAAMQACRDAAKVWPAGLITTHFERTPPEHHACVWRAEGLQMPKHSPRDYVQADETDVAVELHNAGSHGISSCLHSSEPDRMAASKHCVPSLSTVPTLQNMDVSYVCTPLLDTPATLAVQTFPAKAEADSIHVASSEEFGESAIANVPACYGALHVPWAGAAERCCSSEIGGTQVQVTLGEQTTATQPEATQKVKALQSNACAAELHPTSSPDAAAGDCTAACTQQNGTTTTEVSEIIVAPVELMEVCSAALASCLSLLHPEIVSCSHVWLLLGEDGALFISHPRVTMFAHHGLNLLIRSTQICLWFVMESPH